MKLMKTTVAHMQLALCLGLAVSITGCGTGGYWASRGCDACDVFTATIGMGAGAKARIGPVHAGLFLNMDVFGLRNGIFVRGDWLHGTGGMEVDSLLIPMPSGELSDWPYIWGMEGFRVRDRTRPDSGGEAGAVSRIPFISLPLPVEGGGRLAPATRAKYLTQVEVALGLGATVRLGVGLGDLFDFLLGWTTLDILGDDCHDRSEGTRAWRRTHESCP